MTIGAKSKRRVKICVCFICLINQAKSGSLSALRKMGTATYKPFGKLAVALVALTDEKTWSNKSIKLYIKDTLNILASNTIP